MKVNRKISDIVLLEDIKSWNIGDIISITAGTGSGKSYFIENKLYAIAKMEGKKILYLVNRRRLLEQIRQRLITDKKNDIIHVFTYQRIQTSVMYDNTRKFRDEYKYIVCDECHYFITDASFNHTTDISLDMIINSNKQVRIFMSATSNFLLDYLENFKYVKVDKYEYDYNYNHVKKVFFYENNETVEKFLMSIKKNQKVIYFCHSAKLAYDLSKKFDNSLFVCSESNYTYKDKLDSEMVRQMLGNEKFDQQILFTTHTLDNGINIIDKQVKFIIVDIEDFDVMVQCIGRKRIRERRDDLIIIIKKMSNKTINGRISSMEKKIERANYLLENNTEEFIKKYPRQYSGNMIYDITKDGNNIKVVNDVMYRKCIYDIETFKKLLEEDDGYQKKVLELLKKSDIDCEMLEDYFDAATLHDYLDKYVGKKMFTDEQKKFKEFIKKNLINTPKGSHGALGLNAINGFFRDNEIGYVIESKEERKGKNRGKRYWIIGKITY